MCPFVHRYKYSSVNKKVGFLKRLHLAAFRLEFPQDLGFCMILLCLCSESVLFKQVPCKKLTNTDPCYYITVGEEDCYCISLNFVAG